ncbi:MAG: hypothetical protein JW776_00195 [Candidatus Lokiarchaeota archaeon]|nr:hypothetical protein [Candidatus Lokiarchaeota archaeon]
MNPEKDKETSRLNSNDPGDDSSRSLTKSELEMFSKVEEILQTEGSQQIKEENLESTDRTLFAYCSVCQENIFIQYDESIITKASSYPVYLVWVHGKPFHGLLVRIDKNFVSRGERVVQLEFDPELTTHYG